MEENKNTLPEPEKPSEPNHVSDDNASLPADSAGQPAPFGDGDSEGGNASPDLVPPAQPSKPDLTEPAAEPEAAHGPPSGEAGEPASPLPTPDAGIALSEEADAARPEAQSPAEGVPLSGAPLEEGNTPHSEAQVSPNEEWFSELDGFQEAPTPQPPAFPEMREPPIRTDFYTGHWTHAENLAPSENLTRNLKPAGDSTSIEPSSSSIGNADDIPTIPPQPLPAVSANPAEAILPQQVGEVDRGATTLSPAAFSSAVSPRKEPTQPVKVSQHPLAGATPSATRQPSSSTQPNTLRPNPSGSANGKTSGQKLSKNRRKRPWVTVLIVFAVLLVGLVVFAGVKYLQIASSLPDVNELRSRASQFETTRILDRNGNVLYEMIDPNAGKRTYVPLSKISPYLIAATIATEDKEYYNHPGFDLIALGRALWSNYTSGEIVSGASTITQQLARMLLLTNERFDVSYERKAREIILAAEITRRYTKEEVLELYLNEIFYGNLSYGIEAASETYFDTTAANLTLWQSSFLAGLPQSPSVYDIYKNRDATLSRNLTVLTLMYQLSAEKNCIYIGQDLDPVCVSADEALAAGQTLQAYEFKQEDMGMRYPHWVVFIQSLLEAQFDPQVIYRSGFTVYTTLDPDFQDAAQQAVTDQLAKLTQNNATNGAVIGMDPKTGEILAMVGSADFNNAAISGQVNMALTQTRQPGSAIKPITYLAAFEKDWTPSTLIWDVPSTFTPSGKADDFGPAYEPVNYDGRFHGPVTVRIALANSYNIPAVKALSYVGIYDDPTTSQRDGFIAMAERLGITSLTRGDYGLSLTLGGGEVSLLELTSAYSVIANEGKKVSPVAITKVTDHTGQVVFEYKPPQGDQVLRPAHAYLISSILSDPDARAPMFGRDSVLNLPFTAAAKTGTTNDYRDNWTFGYTPDLVVGVWVGNADYTPMVNTSGVTGAAPIWASVMQTGINRFKGGVATPFGRPADVVDQTICAVSGTVPSEYCPSQRTEIFASDQMPLPKENDLWVKVKIDTWTGLIASPACADFAKEELVINVKDPDAIKWLKTDAGKQWADNYGFPDPLLVNPDRECRVDDSRAIIDLPALNGNPLLKENPLKIEGVIDATADFRDYRIDWGEGEKPTEWTQLVDWQSTPVRSADLIYSWDLTEVKATVVSIRVTLRSTRDTQAEKIYLVSLEVPTPTPTITPTVTETPTPTPTETPAPTETPTPTPEPPTLTPTPPTPEP